MISYCNDFDCKINIKSFHEESLSDNQIEMVGTID